MSNIFGLVKNSGEALFHLANGNVVGCSAAVVKAGVSCIPVVGHLPGVGKLVGNAITGELHNPFNGNLLHQLSEKVHNILDINHDGDINLDDISDMLHHIGELLF